jgi:hypothetical protein
MFSNELSLKRNMKYKNFGIGLLISNQLALHLSKLTRKLGGGINF